MGHPESPQPSRQSAKERKKEMLDWQQSIKTKAPLRCDSLRQTSNAAVVALTNLIWRALGWLWFYPEARGVNQQLTAPAHLSLRFDRVGLQSLPRVRAFHQSPFKKQPVPHTKEQDLTACGISRAAKPQSRESRDKSRWKAWALKQSDGSQRCMTRTLHLTAGSSHSAVPGEAREGGREGGSEGYL